MYVIDLTHYLDSKGAIEPEQGPARKIADFLAAVVAHGSDFDRPDDVPGPICFKCRKRDQRVVETGITEDDVVVWRCLACGTEGRIACRPPVPRQRMADAARSSGRAGRVR